MLNRIKFVPPHIFIIICLLIVFIGIVVIGYYSINTDKNSVSAETVNSESNHSMHSSADEMGHMNMEKEEKMDMSQHQHSDHMNMPEHKTTKKMDTSKPQHTGHTNMPEHQTTHKKDTIKPQHTGHTNMSEHQQQNTKKMDMSQHQHTGHTNIPEHQPQNIKQVDTVKPQHTGHTNMSEHQPQNIKQVGTVKSQHTGHTNMSEHQPQNIKQVDTAKSQHTGHTNMPTGAMSESVQTVSLSPREIILANVKTQPVAYKTLTNTIKAYGYVTYDTNKLSTIPSWIEGRIDKLYIKAIGANVRQGDKLTEIYSPELITAQEEYLLSKRFVEDLKESTYNDLKDSYLNTLKSAKKKLKNWGLTDKQIDSINSENDIKTSIPIYSKYTGTVTNVKVQEGNYVKTGDVLYEIADFSSVWVEAEIEESKIRYIKQNQLVDITIDSYPNKIFKGKISYIYPFLDEATRTLKVRINLPSYSFKLKPNMYAHISIKMPIKSHLVVPKTAILNTGNSNLVWKEIKPGLYTMQMIKVGTYYGNAVEVTDGLKVNDKVVVSGGFLVDSESQLKYGVSGGHQH